MAPPELVLILAVGLFAGAMSGALGVGGGIVMVPALVILAGLDQRTAQGTSLLVIVPTAVLGAYSHYRHGLIRARLAVTVGAIGAIGAAAGAVVALHLNAGTLRIGFALFLAVMGVVTIFEKRTDRDEPKLQPPTG